MGNLSGWTGLDSVVNAGANSAAGTFVAQRTGGSVVLNTDFIPVNPSKDIFQLDGYFKKTVA